MSFDAWHPILGLGLFTSDVWEFIVALYDHWESALTGGVLAILCSWAGYHVRRSWGRWVFWSIAAVALVVASFGAWREQHIALVAEHNALAAEHNALAAEHNTRERAEEKYRRIIADLQKRPPTAIQPRINKRTSRLQAWHTSHRRSAGACSTAAVAPENVRTAGSSE